VVEWNCVPGLVVPVTLLSRMACVGGRRAASGAGAGRSAGACRRGTPRNRVSLSPASVYLGLGLTLLGFGVVAFFISK
jgi:hypothetical protein